MSAAWINAPVTMRCLSEAQIDHIARTAYANTRKGRARFDVFYILSMCAEIQSRRVAEAKEIRRIVLPSEIEGP